MKCVVNKIIIFNILLCFLGNRALGAENRYVLTSQAMALAPNAGGQRAYGLRLARDAWEFAAFANTYLLVDDLPIMGATADYRFSFCKKNCWWELFAQVGGGGSSAGPVLEATWGLAVPLLPVWLPGLAPRYVPALRVDLTTQMFLIQWRGITWSYPIWAGVSVPF